MRQILRLSGWLLAVIAGSLLVLGLAVLILGTLPRNTDFQESTQGTDIYLLSNGVHVDLVLPATCLTAQVHPSDFRRLGQEPRWLAIGWGDRGFYLTTPTWGDLKASTALKALSGLDNTLLHIEAFNTPPRPAADMRHLRVSPTQAAALCDYVRAGFVPDAQGSVRPVANAHYGNNDAFYPANGHYSIIVTCNEWVRRGLVQAGIRTAWWSPLPWGIFTHLPVIPGTGG